MPKVRLKKYPKSNDSNRQMRDYIHQNMNTMQNSEIRSPPNAGNIHNENVNKSQPNVAHAPYNFVPLNLSIVEADQFLPYEKYHPERFSGYIDCELETLTPIYIRGCLTEEDIKKGIEAKIGAKQKSDFFSPAGIVRIPGSSIRGMVRHLVEIASWSRFRAGFYEDKNLYYRSFADISTLRDEYNKNMMNPRDSKYGKPYKMSAGYVVKSGFKYLISPAEGDQYGRLTRYEATEMLKKIGKDYAEFNYYKLQDGRHIIVSGSMPRKKDWIIFKIDRNLEKLIEIPENDVNSYKMDENRKAIVPNLLEKCEIDSEVPCFYFEWKDIEGNKRVSFGHTGLFRIAYRKSIGEHIPEVHNKSKIDFAQAMFGDSADNNKESFAGKIFFEDAALVNPNINPFLEEKIPKILLGPKPTTFQHYLEQDSMNPKNLKHYNSETLIRGNKFYWHKSGMKWEKENQTEFDEKKETKIKPVKSNTLFMSRIRYENLTRNELGALLFALKLPPGCAHKIGMGKPIGLGSIKINSTLFIINRVNRYSTLFDNSGWALSENKSSDEEVRNFITDFDNHILKNMEGRDRGNASSLWDTYRLKQLKILLDIEKGKYLENSGKIDYMNLKDFRYRNVLPTPEKV